MVYTLPSLVLLELVMEVGSMRAYFLPSRIKQYKFLAEMVSIFLEVIILRNK
jgi:hypothetical protein